MPSRPHLKWNGRTSAWEVRGPGGAKVLEIGGNYIAKGKEDHLDLNTSLPTKTVRINSRTYVATASIIGLQVKPRAGINLKDEIAGIETQPGINAGFWGKGIIGVKSSLSIKATTGSMSGELQAFQGDIGADSTYAGPVAGPASVLKATNNLHGTVTKGVYLIYALTHGGNRAWDGFAAVPDDNGLAKVASIGGGTAYLRILIGSTSYGLVANAI